MRRLALPLAFCLAIDLQAQATSPRGITAEDYFNFVFVADPRLSPDGSQVAYVSSRVDKAKNRRIPSIWIVASDGRSAPRLLLDEAWSASAPRWSPDGKTIAFASGRVLEDSTGKAGTPPPAPSRAQLWTVPVAGGTPHRVSTVANGVSSCSWSPNASQFVCLVRTGPSDTLDTGPERSDVRPERSDIRGENRGEGTLPKRGRERRPRHAEEPAPREVEPALFQRVHRQDRFRVASRFRTEVATSVHAATSVASRSSARGARPVPATA